MKVIAKMGNYPFMINGLKVTAANVGGTTHVGDLFVLQQRTDEIYDLVNSDGSEVYTFIRLVYRDMNLIPLDYKAADADLAAKLAKDTFCIKESDPATGVEGFSTMYHIHKVKLDTGAYIYRRTNIQPPAVKVTGVTVAPSTLTGDIGSTGQLTATVAPDDATDKSVSWVSSAPAICTVDANGKVTYVAAGTSTVTATTTDGGFTGSSAVTVTTPVVHVTGVTVAPTTLTGAAGGTGQLTATVAPTNATDKTVSWVSSDTAVCTVNTSGLVTYVAAGTSTVTCTTTDGAKTATCAVTVTA